MVGMIPGVECARRRRFHKSKASSTPTPNSTRRSFSLYTPTNMEFLLSSSSSSFSPRRILNEAYPNDNNKLGGAAKEAKQRLDHKFNAHRKSQDNQKPKQKMKSLLYGLCL